MTGNKVSPTAGYLRRLHLKGASNKGVIVRVTAHH